MIKFKKIIYRNKGSYYDIIFLLDKQKMRIVVRICPSDLYEPVFEFTYDKYELDKFIGHLIHLGYSYVGEIALLEETLC